MTDRQRYRLRFSKRDRLRFVSHRDLLQVFQRALRRAGFRVSHTEGFNPHQRLTFAQALPLGVESHDEVLDLELDESPSPEDVLRRLAPVMPPGLPLLACEKVEGRKAYAVAGARYQVPLDPGQVPQAEEALARYGASECPVVMREHKGRVREIPLREFVRNLAIRDGALCFDLLLHDGAGMKPFELLDWLGFDSVHMKVIKLETLAAHPDPGTAQ